MMAKLQHMQRAAIYFILFFRGFFYLILDEASRFSRNNSDNMIGSNLQFK